MLIGIFIFLCILLCAFALWQLSGTHKRRLRYLQSYAFPQKVRLEVTQRYPHLNPAQVELVMDGLRQYFEVCAAAGRQQVAMPSQVVDVAWHAFILFTRQYARFCQAGLGRFLHHTPAEAMRRPRQAEDGLKRAWRLACQREGINPQAAHKLPLLFAIDGLLDIPDGFRYSLNCRQPGADGGSYCTTDIGCSGDGGSDGNDGCSGGGCGGD